MKSEAMRPDPDVVLERLRDAENRSKRGRLKVFLGMCPGVGKTFAMLRSAQKERAEGTRVVVGIVETHGRVETEALLAGLAVVQRRTVAHRGTLLQEMDLEGLLGAGPEVAVVDELAHTNAPGSRHAKRWQDVVELLDAGIHVLSTLNIQHVESRSDAVRQITGAPVNETVPDTVLDLADELELVDLTPEALRERLRNGKVYLGDRAKTAAENFFRESNLNALRELALRFTAERVDRQLRALRRTTATQVVWRSGERLLVAVGPSPFSTQLVRWTRRLSAAQGAPWIAVHVEGSRRLNETAQERLDKNLGLARELGAELVITQGDDIAAALVRVALENNATQIVVGKPRGSQWFNWMQGGNLVDRLIRKGGNIDIYVVPAEPGARTSWLEFEPIPASAAREYGLALGTVSLLTAAGLALPGEYYLATGLVYLLGVLILGLRVGRWPVMAAAVASAFCWNFLFIPPRFTLQISKVEDTTLFLTFFVVALVTGHLTSRVRTQAANESQREQRASALFQLTRALAEARSLDESVFAALRQIDTLFASKSTVLLGETAERMEPHFSASFAVDEREKAVATWALLNRKPAGRFTGTLPSSAALYLPLVREDRAVGVLGISPAPDRTLTLAQRDLLEAFARQLAMAVERDELQAARERERLLSESERLHRTLLDSVSHELRTPLAVITGSLESFEGAMDESLRMALIAEARTAARRLNRLVGNLLDQNRLEGGSLRPRPDWCDPRDLVNAAVQSAQDALAGHPLEVAIDDAMPLVRADFTLTEQALANLLLNASHHTPLGTPVRLTVGIEPAQSRVYFSVADRGPGVQPGLKPRLFRKFERAERARAGGIGLGLSIVRGFITAQGGDVVHSDNPGGGAVFTIYLPHQEPQPEANA